MKNLMISFLVLSFLSACSSMAKHDLTPAERSLETPPPLKEASGK